MADLSPEELAKKYGATVAPDPQALAAKYGATAVPVGGTPPPSDTAAFGVSRKDHPVIAGALDLVQGVGSGAYSIARGASQLAHHAVSPIPELPAAPADVGTAGKVGNVVGTLMTPVPGGAAANCIASLSSRHASSSSSSAMTLPLDDSIPMCLAKLAPTPPDVRTTRTADE